MVQNLHQLAGKFYYIQESEIENTITNDIYNDLLPISESLTNITIVDYFPQEIVNNFDFEYVTQPNIGTISTTIDTSTNSITWSIPELRYGETATVQFKLKLKQNFDSSILNKLLDTNEKVDISYNDTSGAVQTKSSDVTPKLLLSEPPTVLPKAGIQLLIGLCILVSIVLIFSLIRFSIINHNMKH